MSMTLFNVRFLPRLLCLVVLLCFDIAPKAAIAQEDMAQRKAAFLFKLIDYIDWPEDMAFGAGDEFRLCVGGHHGFGDALDVMAAENTKYHYEIIYYKKANAPHGCHMIFTNLPVNTDGYNQTPLWVSTRDGFARNGGMIEMKEEGGKVKLIANLGASEDAGYKISARLRGIMDVIR